MSTDLESIVNTLGLGRFRRHIFLCADQTKPNCSTREKSVASWDFLKRRLEELGLSGPRPLVYRTKANCLRVCAGGPIAVVYPEGVWGTDHSGAFDRRQSRERIRVCGKLPQDIRSHTIPNRTMMLKIALR
jgi:(2Fe-2S) ferredoxin